MTEINSDVREAIHENSSEHYETDVTITTGRNTQVMFFFFLILIPLMNDQNQIEDFMFIFEDLSDIKKQEEDVDQAKKQINPTAFF